MKLPPPPPPDPIVDDFETTPVGAKPRHAALVREEKGGTIRVTDETAASGEHSLKFTDAPGLSKPFYPYLHYQPPFTEGLATVRLALRVERGARVSIEWRERAHDGTGLHVAVAPDGRLTSGGKTVALPLGQWARVETACRLGKDATGTYDLTLTLPGAPPQTFDELPCVSGDRFKRLDWLGFVSLAQDKAVFYLDNVNLDLTPAPK